MAVRDRRGRRERRNGAEGRIQRPNLGEFYSRRLEGIRPGEFAFRLLVQGGAGKAPLPLDSVVEAFDWADEEAVLSGSLTVRRPDPDVPVPIYVGHRVSCDVRWRGGWYRLWQMAVVPPVSTDLGLGQHTIQLKDDLALLSRTRRDWSFRTTRKRKKGWFAHEIVREVARVTGLRVGALAKGRTRIRRLIKRNATALDIIKIAYQKEREETKTRFIIRLRNRRLEVIPLQRNTLLYAFKDEITSAAIEQTQKRHPVTVIRARARIGKGDRARKVRYTLGRRDVIKRFGRVEKEKDYGRQDSLRDLKEAVKRDYARELRVKYSGSISVPCIPFIRRGDGIRWVTREPGWFGPGERDEDSNLPTDRSFVFVTSVRHSVDATGQTTDMELSQTDPYVKDARRRDREIRGIKDDANADGAVGSGDWITVGATEFNDAVGAYGGSLSMGYAELGTAGHNAYMGPLLAPLFGVSGELPENFEIEVRNPRNGRTAITRKRDRGSGQADDRHYKIDLYVDLREALELPANFKGDVQIRRAT